MPEFELSMTPSTGDQPALEVLRARYPEIDVVARYRSTDDTTQLWVCRAPSVAHVERWVDEAGLLVTRVRRLAEP